MTKLPVISGKKAIKALGKAGFITVRQRGNHVRLKKTTFERTINVTVPLHDVLDRGTLESIIRSTGMSVDEFIELL